MLGGSWQPVKRLIGRGTKTAGSQSWMSSELTASPQAPPCARALSEADTELPQLVLNPSPLDPAQMADL